MLLDGKVALITGAASGIGRATAGLFAQQGARVAVVDLDETRGRETVEQIQATGGEAIFVRADVGKMDQVAAMVQASVRHFGRLDVVHSNAAAYALGTATEIDEAAWDRTQDVCLKATWMIARHALPVMLDGGGGTMVITGSVHAIRGYAGHAAYQAAKGGLLALTRSLAVDYAPAIRVNAILPGAVVTGLWDGIPETERRAIARRCPLRRNGQPEDIAQAALFLASGMSAYMTGSYLVVDGGLTSLLPSP
jgi:NAD(P)-dependent dehydrogenase (short-subunit alcohol dehydrogenase family)